jgi:hypothetical protein
VQVDVAHVAVAVVGRLELLDEDRASLGIVGSDLGRARPGRHLDGDAAHAARELVVGLVDRAHGEAGLGERAFDLVELVGDERGVGRAAGQQHGGAAAQQQPGADAGHVSHDRRHRCQYCARRTGAKGDHGGE